MARYEAGETLASIARTYDCSPPAISYIVSRSRARNLNSPSPAAGSEPQLVKSHPAEPVAEPESESAPAPVRPGVPLFSTRREDAVAADAAPARDPRLPFGAGKANGEGARNGADRESHGGGGAAGAGFPGLPPSAAPPRAPALRDAQPAPEPRRTLHLSLGNGGEGGRNGTDIAYPQSRAALGAASGESEAAAPRPAPPQHMAADGYAGGGVERRDGEPGRRKDAAGSFIDQQLRARVDDDIAAFLAAFDAALACDTPESRSALREATDRLLRAGARTRIELERLEARVPLPARDGGLRSEPAWRAR